jgi:hypothetical protein
VGEGFGAIEVNGSVFEGVEEGDIGLDGEEVVGDVVAGGEGCGFCGWIGHRCSSLVIKSCHQIAVKRMGGNCAQVDGPV